MLFVPKNIAQRAANRSQHEAIQQAKYQTFVSQFKLQLAAVQGLKVPVIQTQVFIDLLQGLQVEISQQQYTYNLYLRNANGDTMFEYNWKNDSFYFNSDLVLARFINQFAVTYTEMQHFVGQQLISYFNFRPEKIDSWLYFLSQ